MLVLAGNRPIILFVEFQSRSIAKDCRSRKGLMCFTKHGVYLEERQA